MTTDNLKVGDNVLISRLHILIMVDQLSDDDWECVGEAKIIATTDYTVKLDFNEIHRKLFLPNGWYRLADPRIKIEKITT